MVTVQVGYRRLYNSIGCSLQSEEPVEIRLRFGDLESRVYIGREPPLGIVASTGGDYVVLGRGGSLGTMSFGRKDVSKSREIDLLTDISCVKAIEIDDGTAAAFEAGDSKAAQTLVERSQQMAQVFLQNLDLIAGTIGLRFHRQFVIEILTENPVALLNDGTPAQTYDGPTVELLETPSLRDEGRLSLETILQQVARSTEEAQAFAAPAFAWLLRSWKESDPFSKFMSLFIPLEVVLSAIKHDEAELEEQGSIDKQIGTTLRGHAGGDAERLVREYKKLRQLVHPPLSARFEFLATTAKIDGWEADIVAFKRFNSIRNAILHRGDSSIEMSVPVEKRIREEIRTLEDLAERYVLWSLFRSKEPYKTRHRPKRSVEADK